MPYKDPERQRKFQRERVARIRAEWLSDKVCVRCGSQGNLCIDHIDPKQKVSHRIWSWSKDRREAELVKCQVLCKPHHWDKTREGFESSHGEAHVRAILTEEDVLTMRKAYSNGGITMAELGLQFGISKQGISDIIRGKNWKHLLPQLPNQ